MLFEEMLVLMKQENSIGRTKWSYREGWSDKTRMLFMGFRARGDKVLIKRTIRNKQDVFSQYFATPTDIISDDWDVVEINDVVENV